jgi:hypothetical protein
MGHGSMLQALSPDFLLLSMVSGVLSIFKGQLSIKGILVNGFVLFCFK